MSDLVQQLSDAAPFLAIVALIASIVGLRIFFGLRRHKRVRLWATSRGLESRTELPGDFPTNFFDGIASWLNAHEIISGYDGHDLLLTFEIERGFGRQSYRQTIVSRRPNNFGPPAKLPKGYRLIDRGRWRIGFFQPGFLRNSGARLNPDEIETLWRKLAGERRP